MPFYQYTAKHSNKCCDYCRNGFELLQKPNSEAVKKCPKCGAPVKRIITNFSIGISKSSLDTKAREKGFHKLKRLNKGEYEKEY
jgi:putative FmdB family regulatory protein